MPDEPEAEISPTPEEVPIPSNIVEEPKAETSAPTEALPPLAVPLIVDTPQPTAHQALDEPLAPVVQSPSESIRGLKAEAQIAVQNRKKQKLEKIMSLFLKQLQITNDEVEKLLHVSDATATRYLERLEKEGKVKQIGRTGKGVSYSRF